MLSFALCIALFAKAQTRTASDTIFLEVGSPQVNASLFKEHAARVRVYAADGVTLEADWTNELTLGDSAGRNVMRWVTTGHPVPANPGRPLTVLRQTYDAVTLAPYGYNMQANTGAYIRLSLNGRRVEGVRRVPADAAEQAVNTELDRPGFVAGASDLVPVAAGMAIGAVMVAPMWGPNMQKAEDRVFTVVKDTTVTVEGTPARSRKVEERRRADRVLLATWYLTFDSPYMVYGEVPLPGGGIRRMTEVPVTGKR